MRVDVIAGRFALCDPFAGGSTGTVWRAWDLKQRRYCAAKVLRQRDSGDLIRFTREQAVRLAHRHVLTPYSWVAEDEHVLIASDLVQGGSVSTLIGDWGPLSASTVADVTAQLLDGLAHVHETGLTHRDVKPGNVLLDLTPRAARTDGTGPASDSGGTPFTVRLADFGLAVRSDDARLTQHGLVIGTPGYLSPEALAGDVPAPAQDLYAAGRLALALLMGHEPAELDEPVDLSALPAAGTLGMVVRALLADDPSQRPAAVTARDVLRSGSGARSGATTAFGEPVTLVDQLPPWPAGWSDSGPDPSLLEPSHQDRPDLGAITSAVPVQARVVPDRPITAPPAGRPHPVQPIETEPSIGEPAAAVAVSSSTLPRDGFLGAPAADPDGANGGPGPSGGPGSRAVAPESPASQPQPWSAPPPSGATPAHRRPDTPEPEPTSARPARVGKERWRSPRFIAAAAAVIVWLAALGYLISDVISKASDGGTSSTTSSSSVPPRSTTTASATTTAARAPTTTNAPQTTPPPPALNGPCAFAQEGNEVTSGSTKLRCTRKGSTFSWQEA